jgi:hypothetical protein
MRHDGAACRSLRASRGRKTSPLASLTLSRKVIGFDAIRVRRIARTAVPALVERREPRRLAFQLGAKAHLGVVHRHVRDAAD